MLASIKADLRHRISGNYRQEPDESAEPLAVTDTESYEKDLQEEIKKAHLDRQILRPQQSADVTDNEETSEDPTAIQSPPPDDDDAQTVRDDSDVPSSPPEQLSPPKQL